MSTAREALGRVIWETSRADEGTISATGANIVADAILASPALDAIVAERVASGEEVMSAPAVQALREYGSAIRGDWGDIDGRSVKMELHAIADTIEGSSACVSWDIEKWREDLGLCPTGGGHWTRHCSSDPQYGCGNEPSRW